MEIKIAVETEVSREFLQGMADRMGVSFFKYGPVASAKGKVNEIVSLKKRLELYEKGGTLSNGTVVKAGNTEYLMDVANFAMIEFMHKGTDAFRATDTNESPGIVLSNGRESDERHTEATPLLEEAEKLENKIAPAPSFYRNRKGD